MLIDTPFGMLASAAAIAADDHAVAEVAELERHIPWHVAAELLQQVVRDAELTAAEAHAVIEAGLRNGGVDRSLFGRNVHRLALVMAQEYRA